MDKTLKYCVCVYVAMRLSFYNSGLLLQASKTEMLKNGKKEKKSWDNTQS